MPATAMAARSVPMRLLLSAAVLLLASSAMAVLPSARAGPVGYQCSAGMESSFCVLTVGPCHEASGSSQSGEVESSWQSAGCTLPVVGGCGDFMDSSDDASVDCGPVHG